MTPLWLWGQTAWAASLKSVRMHEAPDSTRVVFDTDAQISYQVFTLENPNRVVVDLHGVSPHANFDPAGVAIGRERVRSLRGAKRSADYRVVIDTKGVLKPKAFTLKPIKPYGHRLVVDLYDPEASQPTPRSTPPSKNRDVVIAIDAGHGGKDVGTISVLGREREQPVLLRWNAPVQSEAT